MTNRLRKYFELTWPQIVFTLGLAIIIAFVMEPHPIRYALAGFMVLLMVPFIVIKVRERRSRGTAQDDDARTDQ